MDEEINLAYIKKYWLELLVALVIIYVLPENPIVYVANFFIELQLEEGTVFRDATILLSFVLKFMVFVLAFDNAKKITRVFRLV